MRNDLLESDKRNKPWATSPFNQLAGRLPKQTVIALILMVALFAFEIFNFDTTRFALESLLGPVNFAGIGWATILAIAFCAIDFAGLAHLFTPEKGLDEPKEVWYLMGAWLLGATMNAVMTWWAVSLTLLSHPFGNEVLDRGQLLKFVPIFVAVLVWLTRILFIGAVSVMGEHLFNRESPVISTARSRSAATPTPKRPAAPAAPAHATRGEIRRPSRPVGGPVRTPMPMGASGPQRPRRSMPQRANSANQPSPERRPMPRNNPSQMS